jgi:hypothetical protein
MRINDKSMQAMNCQPYKIDYFEDSAAVSPEAEH